MLKRFLQTLTLSIMLFPVIMEAMTIEAESYIASHNQGGIAIYVIACSGASGGYAVEGFDYVGDWIELAFTTSGSATYADSLRSAGLLGAQSDIRATYFAAGPGGSNLTSTFRTIGKGIS